MEESRKGRKNSDVRVFIQMRFGARKRSLYIIREACEYRVHARVGSHQLSALSSRPLGQSTYDLF